MPANKQVPAQLGIGEIKKGTRHSKKSTVTIFEKKDDRKKTMAACAVFACEPRVAVYVEATKSGDLYLATLQGLDGIYQSQEGAAVRFWRMTPKYCDVYKNNQGNPNNGHEQFAIGFKPLPPGFGRSIQASRLLLS